MSKISILLAEDQQLIRQALTLRLNEVPEFKVVGSCESGDEVVELAKKFRPDVVLLEIRLKGMDGFAATRMIRKFVPGANIVGVSMHTQTFYVKRLMKSGALGYVTKSSPAAELVEAIEHVSRKRTYICTEIKNALSASSLEMSTSNPISTLTSSELNIIEYLKKGFSSKDISEDLGISERTVGNHRYNVMKKLKVKNTAALINYMAYNS